MQALPCHEGGIVRTLEQILGPTCRRRGCGHPRAVHRGGRGKSHDIECAIGVVRGWASGSRCHAYWRGGRQPAEPEQLEAGATTT